MELQSSHIIYDGLSHNTDCLAFCNNNADLNEILEGIMDFVDTCELTIPSCFTSATHNAGAIIADNTLTSILQGLLTQSCLGWVKVSALDPCWDVLGSKFSSDDGSVLITYPFDAGGCQFIDLSVTPTSVDTSIVKYSNFTQENSGVPNFVYSKSFPFIANTLVNTGDALILDTLLKIVIPIALPFTHVSSYLYINGTLLQGIAFYQGETGKRITLRLVKLSDTTISVSGNITDEISGTSIIVYPSTITVNDLTDISTSNPITIKTGISLHSAVIYSYYLTIDKFTI